MSIRTHILISLLLALVLYPFIKLNAIIVFFSGFLIDVDHYFQYVLDYNDFSIKRAYKHFIEVPSVDVLQIFHVVEAWIILGIMAIYIEALRYVVIGVAVHLILDFIEFKRSNIKGARASSAIMWALRRIN